MRESYRNHDIGSKLFAMDLGDGRINARAGDPIRGMQGIDGATSIEQARAFLGVPPTAQTVWLNPEVVYNGTYTLGADPMWVYITSYNWFFVELPANEEAPESSIVVRVTRRSRIRSALIRVPRRTGTFLTFVIPAKRRAEIVGDFFESLNAARREGYGRFALWGLVALKVLLYASVALRLRAADFLAGETNEDQASTAD